MQAKQSLSAFSFETPGTYSHFGPQTHSTQSEPQDRAPERNSSPPGLVQDFDHRHQSTHSRRGSDPCPQNSTATSAASVPDRSISEQQAGLAHDARNLLSALSLYCDMLAEPQVLKPEHRHYADELRLVSIRSLALIDRLTGAVRAGEVTERAPAGHASSGFGPSPRADRRRTLNAAQQSKPAVSLRQIVDQCSGLLTQIASGRPIVLSYGLAASMPIQVSREQVERILVNLVRNAAAAMAGRDREGAPPDPIRIEIGRTATHNRAHPLSSLPTGHNHVAHGEAVSMEPTPWPFDRIRLAVLDSGHGISAQGVDDLLRRTAAPRRDGHGIGLLIVRELIAETGGQLKIMSTLGVGTEVQMEWPIARPCGDRESGNGHLADSSDSSEDVPIRDRNRDPDLSIRMRHSESSQASLEVKS